MMRTALVGLGDIGWSAHLPALLRHASVELAAVADPSAERRRAASGLATDFSVMSGLDEVLGDASTRAVVLATPPWITPELAVRALQAGRFVLAEKPVAVSTAAASVYDVLTDSQRARLQIGLTYRHDPAVRQLREWLRGSQLGSPLLIRAHIYDERRDPAAPEHRVRIETTLGHGMPVVHEGSHVFDWLAYLLDGGPNGINDAWSLRTDPHLSNPNLCGARLSYSDGSVALVEFGWLTDGLPRCELSVLGPSGHAVLDGSTFRLELTTARGHYVIEPTGDRMARCFDLQMDRFVALAEGQSVSPEPSLVDGLTALALADQIAKEAV